MGSKDQKNQNDRLSQRKNELIRCVPVYIISGVFLCFYLYVLSLGLRPKVTYEYRGFYLDHKLRYKPVEGSLAARPGVRLLLDGKDNSDSTFYGIGKGWSWDYVGKAMENSGYCYTTATDNFLYFTQVDSSKPHSLLLHCKNTDVTPDRVLVNGSPAGTRSSADGETIVIDIPVAASGDDSSRQDTVTSDIGECEIDIVIEDGSRLESDYLIFDPDGDSRND